MVRGPITINPREWARIAMGDAVFKAKLDPRVKSGDLRKGGKEQKADSTDLYQQAPR